MSNKHLHPSTSKISGSGNVGHNHAYYSSYLTSSADHVRHQLAQYSTPSPVHYHPHQYYQQKASGTGQLAPASASSSTSHHLHLNPSSSSSGNYEQPTSQRLTYHTPNHTQPSPNSLPTTAYSSPMIRQLMMDQEPVVIAEKGSPIKTTVPDLRQIQVTPGSSTRKDHKFHIASSSSKKVTNPSTRSYVSTNPDFQRMVASMFEDDEDDPLDKTSNNRLATSDHYDQVTKRNTVQNKQVARQTLVFGAQAGQAGSLGEDYESFPLHNNSHQDGEEGVEEEGTNHEEETDHIYHNQQEQVGNYVDLLPSDGREYYTDADLDIDYEAFLQAQLQEVSTATTTHPSTSYSSFPIDAIPADLLPYLPTMIDFQQEVPQGEDDVSNQHHPEPGRGNTTAEGNHVGLTKKYDQILQSLLASVSDPQGNTSLLERRLAYPASTQQVSTTANHTPSLASAMSKSFLPPLIYETSYHEEYQLHLQFLQQLDDEFLGKSNHDQSVSKLYEKFLLLPVPDLQKLVFRQVGCDFILSFDSDNNTDNVVVFLGFCSMMKWYNKDCFKNMIFVCEQYKYL